VAIGQNIPLFFRLYHKLKQDIIRGEIQKGSKIETIEELSQRHSMSQTSVRKSLELLEKEGLLFRKQGWGSLVPENLDLHFFDLADLISSRKAIQEVKYADIQLISSEWINPTRRLITLLNCKDTALKDRILRLYCRLSFTDKLKFKALMVFYFTEKWLKEGGVTASSPAREIIIRASEWLESGTIKMKESLVPFLCTDEMAENLGLPDGTPVFYQTVGFLDTVHKTCMSWDMISTANVFYRDMNLN
jgi:DNA-binding GntR family transcriptional regulator